MADTPLPVPSPQVLFTEIDDGTGLLLHLDNKFYFTLNATGVLVWKALAERAAGADAIAERIVAEYAVAADVARRDVDAVIANLLLDGLVTPP